MTSHDCGFGQVHLLSTMTMTFFFAYLGLWMCSYDNPEKMKENTCWIYRALAIQSPKLRMVSWKLNTVRFGVIMLVKLEHFTKYRGEN